MHFSAPHLRKAPAMNIFTTVKVFDFSVAPPELHNTIESQMLRPSQPDCDPAMIVIWVGTHTSSLQQPAGASEPPKVTAWEHCLHKWLLLSGANAGDVVLLSWGKFATATMTEPAAAANGAQADGSRPRQATRAEQPAAVH
jgi:hypothetical protein